MAVSPKEQRAPYACYRCLSFGSPLPNVLLGCDLDVTEATWGAVLIHPNIWFLLSFWFTERLSLLLVITLKLWCFMCLCTFTHPCM